MSQHPVQIRARWIILRFMIHISSLLILRCPCGCLHLYLSSFPLVVLHVSNGVMEGWIWAEHLDSVPFAVRLRAAPSWLILQSPPQLMLRGKPLPPRIPLGVSPMLPPAAAQEMFIRAAALHTLLTRPAHSLRKLCPLQTARVPKEIESQHLPWEQH